MFYKYTILDMCDECRMTLHKDKEITSKYVVKEMGQGKDRNCELCGVRNRFTMAVLTDYSLPCHDSLTHQALKEKAPRTIAEGFSLLTMEDLHEESCRES